jgi:hypothetical protein
LPSPAGNCANGGTLHAAAAVLYGATVTLTDSSSPTVSNIAGPLLAGGYLTGPRTASFDASDNVGVRSARIYVDGQPQPATTYTCDFTYTVPCSNRSGSALTLDTATLTDGTHSVQVAASDPASNEAKSPAQTITIDNGAPAAPQQVAVDGGETHAANSFSVSWTNPDGQTSPIVAAHWHLCDAQGASCAAGRQAGQNISRLDGILVPSPGAWRLSVWLEDGAGNASAGTAAAITLRYAPPAAERPGPAPAADPAIGVPSAPTSGTGPGADPLLKTPRLDPRLRLVAVRYRHGRLTVRGRMTPGAAGRLTIRLRAGRHALVVGRTVTGGAFRIAVRAPRPRRVSVAYPGSGLFLPTSVSRLVR